MAIAICSDRIYQNVGNAELLKLIVGQRPGAALDCGCGAGDNARVLVSLGWVVEGITISPGEMECALKYCEQVHLHDMEGGMPKFDGRKFDLIIFSHSLEHLRKPEQALQDASSLLKMDGRLAIALPNVLYWKNRAKFLLGQFEYQEAGIMDSTHVRFYTFDSGRALLELNGYEILQATVEGAFPLRPLRRILPSLSHYLDLLSCRIWPGLFGYQLLYTAKRRTALVETNR